VAKHTSERETGTSVKSAGDRGRTKNPQPATAFLS
jgi:hypothetical protein